MRKNMQKPFQQLADKGILHEIFDTLLQDAPEERMLPTERVHRHTEDSGGMPKYLEPVERAEDITIFKFFIASLGFDVGSFRDIKNNPASEGIAKTLEKDYQDADIAKGP